MSTEFIHALKFVNRAKVLVWESSHKSITVERVISWVQFLFYGLRPASDYLEDCLHILLLAHVLKVKPVLLLHLLKVDLFCSLLYAFNKYHHHSVD